MLVVYNQVDKALDYEDYLLNLGVRAEDLSSDFDVLLLEMVLNLVKEKLILFLYFLEVVNLPDDFLLELLPWILVVQCPLPHLLDDLREVVAEIEERPLAQARQGAVV